MKRIGIDARLYSKTGVGVYIRNLLYYLQKLPVDGCEFYIYVLKNDKDKILLSNKHFHLQEVPYIWHTFSEQIGFVRRLYKDHLDLVHFPYFSYPVLYRRPFIATVHDTILLRHKTGKASTHLPIFYELKHAAFNFAFRSQLKHAARIITPTHTVKQQIIEIYGPHIRNKIQTIYEGIDYELIKAEPNNSLEKSIQSPFFLYVGNFYPHKNIEALVKAFTTVPDKYKLLLVGPDDYFSQKISEVIQANELKSRVVFHKNVSIEDLVFYYKNAKALIHPSLDEGFGLPLLEAAYFDLPVIASDIKVFHEVLGNSFTSFDPNSQQSITQAIAKFIQNGKKYSYQNVTEKYSFQTMSEQILTLYKQIVFA